MTEVWYEANRGMGLRQMRKRQVEGEIPSPRADSSSPQAALASAHRILALRDHGSGELKVKLLRRGFAQEAVEAALRSLLSKGFLDDQAFAKRYAESELQRGQGPVKIRAKLRARGVLEEPPLDAEVEEASLRELLRRKGVASSTLTDPKARAKIQRFLRGRGYTTAAVMRVLGRAGGPTEEP